MEIKFRIMNEDDLCKVIDLCNLCFDENTSIEYAKNIYEKLRVIQIKYMY